jgi:hypothetical protein
VSVAIAGPEEGDKIMAYTSLEDAMKNPEQRAQVLADALRELRSFTIKYKTLHELAGLHKIISRLLVRLTVKIAKAKHKAAKAKKKKKK